MADALGVVEHATDVNKTIHVSHLPMSITHEDVVSLFASCGPILYVRILGDDNVTNQKFAFVEFLEVGGYEAAFHLSGMPVGTSTIAVSRSNNGCVKPHIKIPPDVASRIKTHITKLSSRIKDQERAIRGSRKRSRSRSRETSSRRRSRDRKRSRGRH
eukprot:NODE_7320_length_775_cov_97.277607_g7079_i0.p1 GENE.NODE_7320_length_775_cov_97.277607_g7079_i0~~NODE_7320_length_775_cov_97.277607_g7079_i0.p1  ORF type:complete len:158 (-),score=15.23 NODE_7320_length_775_cov_97.277607_g7079_i0:201-674(-)